MDRSDDIRGATPRNPPAKVGVHRATGGADSATPEDAALIERLLAGDEAAFAGLIDGFHGRLVRLARTFVKDQATAEEVVQDTWVGVLDGLRGFEGRSAIKTWIFRILVNRAKTRGVREARSVPFSGLPGLDDVGEPAVDPSRFGSDGMWADPPRRWEDDTPETLLLREEARGRLEQAVEDLPARQRAVLVLRDIEGVSADEVCNILEIADTNQRVLLHRARSALHRALDRCLEEE
ncbi:sigma-70 family RNA polymerase sigma factor [Myxococcota bacterium]|nr:sigma-70 family RNA polymerase sigma factor [Myxococcota bacterium]